MEVDSKLKSSLLYTGRSLINLGEFSEGIKEFERILDKDPNYVDAWISKGEALSIQGRFDEALNCFDRAIKVEPKRAEIFYNMGITYLRMEEFDKMEHSFQKALDIDPSSPEALITLGKISIQMLEFKDAINYLKESLEIDPNSVESWIHMAFAYLGLGEYESAIKCYESALEIDPTEAQAYTGIGLVYLETKSFKEAEEYLDKSMAIYLEQGDQFKVAETLINIGTVLLTNTDEKVSLEKNLSYFEKALEIYDKLGAKFATAGCYFSMALLFEKYDKLSKAQQYLEQAENQYHRYSPARNTKRDPFLLSINDIKNRIADKLNDRSPSNV
jgi:tetratricopeptide (TPR) repeat protein